MLEQTLKIVTLSRAIKLYTDQLVELDKKTYEKFGYSFSNESWSKQHFLYDLPKKFEISLVAIIDNNVAGYCIASASEEYYYIHRFVTDTNTNINISTQLLKEFVKDKKLIYLMVSTENKNAIRLFESFSFSIVDDRNELKSIVKLKDQIKHNYVQILRNYKCYLMKRN